MKWEGDPVSIYSNRANWAFKLLSSKNHSLFPSLSCAFKLILGISVFGSKLGMCSAWQRSKVPRHKVCGTPENAPLVCHLFKVRQSPSNWIQLWVVYRLRKETTGFWRLWKACTRSSRVSRTLGFLPHRTKNKMHLLFWIPGLWTAVCWHPQCMWH